MKPNVILYRTIPEPELMKLQTHFNVSDFTSLTSTDDPEFMAALAQAEGLIGSGHRMPPQLLDKAPKLRAISTITVGTDLFDGDYLSKRNIPLMHTPVILNETVADTVILLALGAARRAIELSDLVRNGEWKSDIEDDFYGCDLHGKTLGIIGMGRIGHAVAKRAKYGFDMNICYCNRSVNADAEKEFEAKKLTLDELLKTSDFVCLLTPLTPETEKLIGQRELNLMKPSAILVNAARGKVVDESALIEALKNKTIRAAGLDVFEVEPLPVDSPLVQLKNTFLLPHVGSASTETRLRMVQCAIDNLISAMDGNGYPEKNCANRV